jgi:beta-xylosidase
MTLFRLHMKLNRPFSPLLKSLLVASMLAPLVLQAAPQPINPGDVWLDDRGKPIEAHGGGIIQLGDTYYWFGEDRTETNDPLFRYVACYSSQDLAHWQFRKQVVKLGDPENLGPKWVLERPKVFYNALTRKYVMYVHLDGRGGYKFASIGILTCDTIDGHYQYLKSFRPLGQESRDIGQFIDDDGSAYLIFEDRPNGFHIAQLSEDYLDVVKDIHLFPKDEGGKLEGGALVHYNGLYYVIGSQMTGWRPNPNQYATAPSLGGPWSGFEDIAPPSTNTYGSQSSMLLKVVGTKTTSVIFIADIWKPKQLSDSRYLWMPLQFGDHTAFLPAPKPWTLDVTTGESVVK